VQVFFQETPELVGGKDKITDIGERIRLVRVRHRLSQGQVARIVGASVSAISSYETGETAPRADWLLSFCEAFNVNGHWLLTGKDRPGLGDDLPATTTPGESAPVVHRDAPFCGLCGRLVEPDWKACPFCQHPLAWQ
jgi:DNA-binding XRE family transcriptional regulator